MEKLKQKYLNKRFTRLLIIDIVKIKNKHAAKCVCDCGNITVKNFGDLSVHHIYSWNTYKNLRFEINNGITLSKSIHNEFHKIYGKGNNDMNQFIDYIEKYHKNFDLNKLLSRSLNECKSCEG